jgi:hypothetical protein
MAQIWLTYDELAELIDCTPASARDHAIREDLARRRSRDGNTRVKLSKPLIEAFLRREVPAQARQDLQEALELVASLQANILRAMAGTMRKLDQPGVEDALREAPVRDALRA